jgi:K+-transporting ATPase KdpF subunit
LLTFAVAKGSGEAPVVENVLLIVVCVLLLGYLLTALLKPEKF